MTATEAAAASTDNRIRAVLVDDHPLFRLGLRTLLDRDPEIWVTADVGSSAQALELAATTRLDVAIIDLLLPGTGGVALTGELRRLQPTCKILGLSMIDEPMRIAEMLRAGASGFALKSQPLDDIVSAIKMVATGTRYLPATVSHDRVDTLLSDADAWPLERLTHREREVFELLVAGYSNESIATRLFIARRTVETHRQHITRKLGARSMVDLVRIAVQHGVAGM
ncbi:MAG: response regulator transcription factor [Myxococcota bacterium]|nr:response regulator transcription factor [Myxococcota bacterium]